MKIILITGGAGFIGSHLAKKLLDAGNKIICLDNFYTGRMENIAGFLKNKNFKLLKRDVAKPLAIKADEIYNLACPASPRRYRQNPVKTIKTSVFGALNMLALAKKNKARILQASTSEVYGDPLEHPQKETYWGNVNPIGVRSCYDEGKRLAETLCMDYWRQYKTEIRIVRIFNTYGPNMNPDDGRVVSNFIAQALRGKDITIYGGGSQTRSFQYIDDLTEGMIRMMKQDEFIGPVNLGNPNEFTVKELADKVLKMIPESKSKIVYTSLPEDDPRKRKPDISLAKEKLGWEPKIELEEGLGKTIEYFKGKL
ncbi:SDR family oxidoreductase [Patescibacteria group bacterium]|nr:SDR family oxidoreductase [Patescibacteria group bacterium]MBU4337953.1 SDR family oxidoreductase [Patescibacteria group bacterium]MBU4579393.1 SDR family oxidoreductase [Patescibacteria group bacterium]